MNDTIAAIATPVGKSGIGIVRLSGKDAVSVADRIFIAADGRGPSQFSSHTLHYGWIVDSEKRKAKSAKHKRSSAQNYELIDEVLLTVMRAPRTYTREDIVEINCHSGIVVLKRILELVLKMGARPASPGEFTKRAYLNGRIDLVQAEAVLDVVNAQTKDALAAALGQLRGRFSRKINNLRRRLIDVLTQLEAAIDFSEEDIQPKSLEKLLTKMQKTSELIKELLDSADKGIILRAGIACVICGKPNVGKSSLLNALLKRERAIVTPIPGTTRDVLEETIDLFGIPLRLIDTAGIIQGGRRNLAEEEAVQRSRKYLKEANLALLVLDASRKLTSEDLALSRQVAYKPAMIILNKQDLPAKIGNQEAGQVFPRREVFNVSALSGLGLDRLERGLADFIWQGKASTASNGELLVTNVRHKLSLQAAQKSLKRAMKAQTGGQGQEIVAWEIKQAQRSLGEIIGEINCEDILERIFAQFCIGK